MHHYAFVIKKYTEYAYTTKWGCEDGKMIFFQATVGFIKITKQLTIYLLLTLKYFYTRVLVQKSKFMMSTMESYTFVGTTFL